MVNIDGPMIIDYQNVIPTDWLVYNQLGSPANPQYQNPRSQKPLRMFSKSKQEDPLKTKGTTSWFMNVTNFFQRRTKQCENVFGAYG